jgi:hypothetical protein
MVEGERMKRFVVILALCSFPGMACAQYPNFEAWKLQSDIDNARRGADLDAWWQQRQRDDERRAVQERLDWQQRQLDELQARQRRQDPRDIYGR